MHKLAPLIVVASLASPSAAQEASPKKPRELDRDSPVAKALDELVVADPRYGKDGRVELAYDFSEPAHLEDFTYQGFDKIVSGRNRKKNSWPGVLDVGVGSRSQGLVLHNIPLRGDFELEWTFLMESTSPSSQLVFVCADGKSGAIFGSVFSKRTRAGYRPVERKAVLDRSHLNAGEVTVRLVVAGKRATAYVNGQVVAETTKLNGKLDGRVGIFATNLRVFVKSFKLQGEVDPRKL
jgi:hypothetical protein